jgi:hypothetical protein
MERKVFLYSFAVILVAVIGFFGYRYYKTSSTINAIIPLLQNVSIRVSNDIRYEYESSEITTGELFDKIEKDLSEIDSKIIEMQSLPTIFCEEKVTVAIAYAQSCQELLRALRNNKNKMHSASFAMRWEEKAFDLFKVSSNFGVDHAKNNLNEAIKESETKIQEYKESVKEVPKIIKKVEDNREKAIKIFPARVIIEESVLKKLNNKFIERMKKITAP